MSLITKQKNKLQELISSIEYDGQPLGVENVKLVDYMKVENSPTIFITWKNTNLEVLTYGAGNEGQSQAVSLFKVKVAFQYEGNDDQIANIQNNIDEIVESIFYKMDANRYKEEWIYCTFSTDGAFLANVENTVIFKEIDITVKNLVNRINNYD